MFWKSLVTSLRTSFKVANITFAIAVSAALGVVLVLNIYPKSQQPSIAINTTSQLATGEHAKRGEGPDTYYTDSYYSAPRPTVVGRPYPVYQEASTTVLPVVKRGTLNGKDGFIVTSALGEYEFVTVNAATAVDEDVQFLARTFNPKTQEFEYDVVDTK